MTLVTSFFALIAALGGVLKVADVFDPYVPATRWFVQERITEYSKPVDDLLRWRVEDLINEKEKQADQLNSEQTNWTTKLPAEQDPMIKQIIQNRLDAINKEKDKLAKDRRLLEQRLDEMEKNQILQKKK